MLVGALILLAVIESLREECRSGYPCTALPSRTSGGTLANSTLSGLVRAPEKRGSSALGCLREPGHDRQMSQAKDLPIAARVIAGVPLLQAGLERAALAVGLRVADGDETAAIGLRSPNTGPTQAAIDVCADADHVTITLTAVPDSKTWFRLLALLRELLDVGS